MTTDQIVDCIVQREGGYVDDTNDRGGPTNMGITAATLGIHRGLGRQASRAEVKALTLEEARDIYRQRYVDAPGFSRVIDEDIRALLVDDGVLSGPAVAIKTLQRALGIAESGVLSPPTIERVARANVAKLKVDLVKLRILRFGRIVQGDTTQARFLVGWIDRAMSFL